MGHWDLHVRELAAKALNRLSSVAPSYLAESVMPQLLKNVEASDDLFLKHGSILAIGELSLGISIEASKTGETLTKFFGENIYLTSTLAVRRVRFCLARPWANNATFLKVENLAGTKVRTCIFRLCILFSMVKQPPSCQA